MTSCYINKIAIKLPVPSNKAHFDWLDNHYTVHRVCMYVCLCVCACWYVHTVCVCAQISLVIDLWAPPLSAYSSADKLCWYETNYDFVMTEDVCRPASVMPVMYPVKMASHSYSITLVCPNFLCVLTSDHHLSAHAGSIWSCSVFLQSIVLI